MGRYDKVYEKVKNMTSKKTSGKGIAVQDKDGVLLQDPREVRICGRSISEQKQTHRDN